MRKTKQSLIDIPNSISKLRLLGLITIFFIIFSTPVSSVGGQTSLFEDNIELNLEMTYRVNLQSFSRSSMNIYMWISRYIRQDDVQYSDLLENSTMGPTYKYQFDPSDIFGNQYDYYYTTLGLNDKISVTYKYNLTLRSKSWDIPENITLEQYNKSDSFYKLYTRDVPHIESDDPLIVQTAQEIVGTSKEVSVIIEKIYDFVISHINYTVQTASTPKGAKQALLDGTGDCSEYSALMVALLRASGVPAKKVLGFGLTEGDASEPKLLTDLRVGMTWEYTQENLPAHAWVQYYVPGQGWISADPTWGNAVYWSYIASGSSESEAFEASHIYLNSIDYLHVISTTGDVYSEGIDPELTFPSDDSVLREFAFAYIVYESYGGVAPQYTYSYSFKVLGLREYGSTSQTNFLSTLLSMGPSTLFIILGIVVILALLLKGRRKRVHSIEKRFFES